MDNREPRLAGPALMAGARPVPFYTRGEEVANIASHGLGVLFSLAAALALVLRALARGDAIALLGFGIFGAALVELFSASTLYHAARDPARRRRLRVADHASIYILIAGTYSAYCLTALRGTVGWAVFALVWGLAAAGLVLAIFFTGRYKALATASYIAMGWVIIFAMVPLRQALDRGALVLLFAGGLAYTLGALVYAARRIPWNHAIWHLFVLCGAACHFASVMAILGPR